MLSNLSVKMAFCSEAKNDYSCYCDREVFCCVCNEHIHWKSFTCHIIQHCSIHEDDFYCPMCNKCCSCGSLLIHLEEHLDKEHGGCLYCCCSSAAICGCCLLPPRVKAVDRVSDSFGKKFFYFCYICHARFINVGSYLNHMQLHVNEAITAPLNNLTVEHMTAFQA